MSPQKKKKKKKVKKKNATKVFLMPVEETEEDIDDEDEDESSMYLEKEDIQLIYNALKNYKPANDEEMLHEILLEQFDEILVVDYGKPIE
jgi:hypothetical protein